MAQYIPWIIAAASLLVAYLGYTHSVSRDQTTEHDKTAGKFDSIMQSIIKLTVTVEQVDRTTSDIRLDLKSMDKRLNDVDKDLAVVKRDVKTAFNKIDEINKKLEEET